MLSNNLPQPDPYIHFVFLGVTEDCCILPTLLVVPSCFCWLRKIVACSYSSLQCLLVSTVFGMVSSLHPTSFLMILYLLIIVLCLVRRKGTIDMKTEPPMRPMAMLYRSREGDVTTGITATVNPAYGKVKKH